MKKEKQLDYLIALLIFINIYPVFIFSHYLPLPGNFVQLAYYALMLMVLFLFGLPGKFETSLVFVVFAAVLSLLVNDVAEKYNAPLRLSLFVIVILSIGPLLYNATLVRFRKLLYEKLMLIFMWIGGVSFFCLLGLPTFGIGHFSGLLAHSMLLAPVASLGGLYAFSKCINAEKRQKKLFFGLFGLNTVCVIYASSRSALAAYVFGFIIYLLLSHFAWRKSLIVVLGIFALFLSISSDDQTQIQPSSEGDTVFSRDMEENTRENLWNDRIAEFNSSPLVGVGFAVQSDAVNDQVAEDEEGRVEPGSTYLMVLSMTGSIGGFAFLVFLIKPLLSQKFWQQVIYAQPDKMAAFAFFMVHFFAEGYIFAAGSLLAFTFWLLMGVIYPYKGVN
ncbi:O-antigen ligase family protein [Methylobacter psychrophilus]|uniref:O-antigen ligase family protein n=1 Tax=Methylobacter psychrophilus TaxID=96941 RepID=UPI0021D4CE84|nr:O-antigen ligase family protein [Methylobacter psychrophilus]